MTTTATVPQQGNMEGFSWVSADEIPAQIRMGGRLKSFALFLKERPMRWTRLDKGHPSSSRASGIAGYLKGHYGLEAMARTSERGGTYYVYARFVPSDGEQLV